MKISAGFVLALMFCLANGTPACAQKNPFATTAMPMKRLPLDPNAPRWHTIKVTPRPDLPKIHFYDKLNPVWWFGNADEPVAPTWYLPDDPHRETKWNFRNPFHNFNFYVIGVADKTFYRSGRYPKRNSNPNGGWNFAVTRRRAVLLPFASYDRSWCIFYFGWRERGNFGIKLNFPDKPKPKPDTNPPIKIRN